MTMKRRAPLVNSQVITLPVYGNPRPPWGAAFRRFALYRTGMTGGAFLAAGGARGDLWCDQYRGFIRVV